MSSTSNGVGRLTRFSQIALCDYSCAVNISTRTESEEVELSDSEFTLAGDKMLTLLLVVG